MVDGEQDDETNDANGEDVVASIVNETMEANLDSVVASILHTSGNTSDWIYVYFIILVQSASTPSSLAYSSVSSSPLVAFSCAFFSFCFLVSLFLLSLMTFCCLVVCSGLNKGSLANAMALVRLGAIQGASLRHNGTQECMQACHHSLSCDSPDAGGESQPSIDQHHWSPNT